MLNKANPSLDADYSTKQESAFFEKKASNNKNYIIEVSSNPELVHNSGAIYTSKGNLLYKFEDSKLSDNSFIRKSGQVKTVYADGIITQRKLIKNFPPISNKYPERKFDFVPGRFGSFDIETYKVSEGLYMPYALGFYSHYTKELKTFYIDDKFNHDQLFTDCFDSILKDKYTGHIFYVHNMAGFDIVYILKYLNPYIANKEKYSVDIFSRDDKVLYIKIGLLNSPRYFTLVDSYFILNERLDKLGESFEVKVRKTYFPYSFVKQNTLFYEGAKPDISFYKNKSVSLPQGTYDELDQFNPWSTKIATLKYLEKDLVCLAQVMWSFHRNMKDTYGVQTYKLKTLPSIALKTFLTKYYNNQIPLITNGTVESDIRQSYYGGITEVYKPYGENLYYYDVNSLYPYASLNDLPGLNAEYGIYTGEDLSNLFGFFKCHISAPNSYLGLLPVRTKKGLVCPTGSYEGWYFSEELKLAVNHGYKVKLFEGYNFEKVSNVFNEYVNKLYNIKANP